MHVAVAVVRDDTGRVLICRRPDDKHMAGFWEFPGGKVEAGESLGDALRRELLEELSITVNASDPLISLVYDYPDRTVWLDVQAVDSYAGRPRGCEGQTLAWVAPDELADYRLLPANRPIVTALRLPPLYAITPPDMRTPEQFATWLGQLRRHGQMLPWIQLRLPPKVRDDEPLLAEMLAAGKASGATMILNGSPAVAQKLGFAGVHLDGQALHGHEPGLLDESLWVGASCHGTRDLTRARRLEVDFAVLSPVRRTLSHPEGVMPLGWERFGQLARNAGFPVYALGGLAPTDLDIARRYGARGVAGIRAFRAL